MPSTTKVCNSNPESNLQRFRCERNWVVFECIHTKKRNYLEQQWLNDLVFMQYNLQLRHNQLNKTTDVNPIVLEDIDPSSKWVVETWPIKFEDDDLGGWTWIHK
jgi:hypothetical protein